MLRRRITGIATLYNRYCSLQRKWRPVESYVQTDLGSEMHDEEGLLGFPIFAGGDFVSGGPEPSVGYQALVSSPSYEQSG